jgi:serine/threonine protein phosphatase PrpC
MQPVMIYTSGNYCSSSSAKTTAKLAHVLLRNLLSKSRNKPIFCSLTNTANISLAYSLLNRLKYIILNNSLQCENYSPRPSLTTSTSSHLNHSPSQAYTAFQAHQSQTNSFLFNLFNLNFHTSLPFPFLLSLGKLHPTTAATNLHLITAYSGYSKEYLNNHFNANIKRTEFLNGSNGSNCGGGAGCKKGGVIGDDAWFMTKQKSIDVLGVADGVGGWSAYGIDPSKFSFNLMKTCKRIVDQDYRNISSTSKLNSQNSSKNCDLNSCTKSSALSYTADNHSSTKNIKSEINSKTPLNILEESYRTLLENKNSNLFVGSSTACILIFHHDTSLLHTCNLGDSGFVVIRDSRIIHRSQEQQHYFNSPFQLAILPKSDLLLAQQQQIESDLINDSPEAATSCSIELIEGDFIVLGTDGLWDNLTENHLLVEISKIKVRYYFYEYLFAKKSKLISDSKIYQELYNQKFGKSGE